MIGEVTFEVKKHIGVIKEYDDGEWKRELNIVEWNGGAPVYDVRDWNKDHTHMSRGITLKDDEPLKLAILLNHAIAGEREVAK